MSLQMNNEDLSGLNWVFIVNIIFVFHWIFKKLQPPCVWYINIFTPYIQTDKPEWIPSTQLFTFTTLCDNIANDKLKTFF